MAYNKDQYQLTHLLQDAWLRMGQMRVWSVTGGSTTTVENTDWALGEEPQFEDDDASLIFGTAVVVRDSAGAGAAPEGEFGMITDYDSSSSIVTIDSVSSTISSGDKVGIATPLLPVQDMIELTNIMLRKIGEIDVIDTTLVVAANQTEYTLPSTIQKRPIRVRIQGVQDALNNQWRELPNTSIIPATAGSNWTLVIPDGSQGYTLEIMYRGMHPEVTAFDSPIQASIHPELALSALIAEAYQWYNNQVGGSNQYLLQRENKAIQDLESARVLYPVKRTMEQVSGMPHWGVRGNYVPLTSDLIGE